MGVVIPPGQRTKQGPPCRSQADEGQAWLHPQRLRRQPEAKLLSQS